MLSMEWENDFFRAPGWSSSMPSSLSCLEIHMNSPCWLCLLVEFTYVVAERHHVFPVRSVAIYHICSINSLFSCISGLSITFLHRSPQPTCQSSTELHLKGADRRKLLSAFESCADRRSQWPVDEKTEHESYNL